MSAKKKSGNDKWKIVIVEDSPTQAEQLKYILEAYGYQVVAASNGKEAFALLKSDKPNLVISDIVMPEMDGYELCKQIKTDEKFKDVPVILLTALSDPADVIRGLECGADNFITKPYDERVLFSRIEYLQLNWRLAESKQVQMGVEITFSGQKYFITSDRLQILNLLLSTYEVAVSKSKELEQAQGELIRLNEQLEQRVKARTAKLAKANEELKLEITERKQVEEKVRQAAREWETTFDSMSDLISIHDKDYRIVKVNKAYADAFKMRPGELTGKTCYEVVHGTKEPWPNCPHQKALENKKTITAEFFEPHLGIHLEVTASPVFDETGDVIGSVHITRDITERKRAEEALGESEKRYRTLFESAAEGILIADIEAKKFKYANPAVCRMLGYSPEELTKMDVGDIHPKASLEHVFAEFDAQARGEKALSPALPCLKKDGTIIYADINGAKAIIDGRECNIGFFTDITERKQLEQELQQSRNSLLEAQQIARVGSWDWDILTNIVSYSDEFHRIFDQHIRNFEAFLDSLHPDDRELVEKSVNEALWANKPYDIEYRVILPNEEERIIYAQGKVTFDNAGKPVRMIGTVQDITERKQAEEALGESEKRYRTLFESAAEGILIADIEAKKFKYANPAVCTMLGYSLEEFTKMSVSDIHPKTSQEHVLTDFAAQARGEKIFSPALPCLKKDGTIIYADVKAAKGIIDGRECNVGFFTDITDRKRIEKRLWDSMSNFHKVVNDNTDGIIVTDRQGTVQFANPAAELLFGRKSEDFKGKKFGFPIKSGDKTEINIIRKPGDIVAAEMRTVETVWYDKFAHLISLHNITERKQAQIAQERLSRQLQAQVSELETFSYGIAHDLRSPLVSIEGFSRELRTDMLNQDKERVQEDVRLLESGVRKMQDFLNSTLEYSRSGQLIKRTKNVSFGKIVNEVITGFNGQISSIGATVSVAKTFPRVYADKMRMIQVLTNLIQNSIKYRDKTVPLKIKVGHRLSEGEVVFFVRDNGIGIDASSKEKLFTLFYRGTAEGEGSGIGLAIVKKIIEAHGGRIWVQQGQSGKGTTMCFTLDKQSSTNKGDNNGKD